MDQTRVTQLLPWRCVLEIGNAKIQSLAYRQFFKETKKKRTRVRVILRKLGVFNDFWTFVGIFGCFEFLIRPTYTKGECFLDMCWANPGRQGSGKVHPKMKKPGPVYSSIPLVTEKKNAAMVVMLLWFVSFIYLSHNPHTDVIQKGQKNHWMNLVNHSTSDLNAWNEQKRGNPQGLLCPP